VLGYLSKPFYLPDLLALVDKALEQMPEHTLPGDREKGQAHPDDQRKVATASSRDLDWLEDVNRAAQHLASLSMESASQAALILKNGQLWAYAGHLAKEEAQELAQIVQRDWRRNVSSATGAVERNDLARFVRLKVSGEDYMLYATGLDIDMLLVLAFDVRTPISKIRTQASELVRALESPQEMSPAETQEVIGRENSTRSPGKQMAAPAETPPAPPVEEFSTLLPAEEVPPPTPPGYRGQIPEVGKVHWPWEFDPELEEISATTELRLSEEVEGGADREEPPSRDSTFESGAVSFGSVLSGSRRVIRDSPGGEGENKLSTDDLRSVPSVILSPPVVYVIHYACVLLPRLPGHRLTGDLLLKLREWMQSLSIALGWRLEYLLVEPGYLHWIIGATPQTSADEVIEKVRVRSTEMIFSEFPSISQGNLCDDFWAPGFLVVTGSNPLPAELVNEYIEQTRLRQGITGKG
jgi:REP element-mobilizing transposase RayT